MTFHVGRRPPRGRHHFDPDTAPTVGEAIRSVPEHDPRRVTGEIPGLADAQRALLEQRTAPVPPAPPAATLRRVASGLRSMDMPPAGARPTRAEPRPRAVPPRVPGPAMNGVQAKARIDSLRYPEADVTSGHSAAYTALMAEMDRITGTRGRGGAWNRPAAIETPAPRHAAPLPRRRPA